MQEITGDKKERTGGLEMLEDKDYVMRIVHEWIRTLIKLIFNKDIDNEEDAEIPLEVMEQFRKLQAMIDDGEDIEVKCHFCNTAYRYTVDELKGLLKKSR